MLAAGFLAGRHILELNTLYIVAILSSVAGDSCGFAVGRTGGRRLFEWLSEKSKFLRRRYLQLKALFQAHGRKAVFFARFIMGVRFVAGPTAGAAGMGFCSFFGWNLLGALIWCFVLITLGYSVGNRLDWVVTLAQTGGRWIAVTVFLIVAGIWLFWRKTYRRGDFRI